MFFLLPFDFLCYFIVYVKSTCILTFYTFLLVSVYFVLYHWNNFYWRIALPYSQSHIHLFQLFIFFYFFARICFVLGSLQYANEYWYMLRERLMACVELHVCIGSTICLIDVSLYHTTLTRVQDLSIITSLYCI